MNGYDPDGETCVVDVVVDTSVEAIVVGATTVEAVGAVDVASADVVVGCTAMVGRDESRDPSATAPLTSPAATSAPSAPRIAVRRRRSRRPRLRTVFNMSPSARGGVLSSRSSGLTADLPLRCREPRAT